MFLPAYSPDLAPIETVFSLLKTNITKLAQKTTVRFTQKTGSLVLYKALKGVTAATIVK